MVIENDAPIPEALFTVKHEMVTWMKRNYKKDDSIEVFRYRDGWRDPAVRLNTEELFALP